MNSSANSPVIQLVLGSICDESMGDAKDGYKRRGVNPSWWTDQKKLSQRKILTVKRGRR